LSSHLPVYYYHSDWYLWSSQITSVQNYFKHLALQNSLFEYSAKQWNHIFSAQKARISREPVALLGVPSTSSKQIIDRFLVRLTQTSDIDPNVLTSGEIAQTNVVPGIQLEYTDQLSNLMGKNSWQFHNLTK
jgi:hypothetical protein